MTEFTSSLAHAHRHSPNTYVAGCLNSRLDERGVIFPNIEVLNAEYCFVGETSLIEAIAVLYDLEPNVVRDLLNGVSRDTTQHDLERRLTSDVHAGVKRIYDAVCAELPADLR